jgi:hypothetical protein
MPDGFEFELDVEGFRAWTEAAIKEVEKETGWQVLRAIALKFIAMVVEKTPVDFGRARAGWTSFAIAMGRSPRLGVTGSKGVGGRAGVGTSATEEQAKGLEEGSFRMKRRGKDQFIEVINGVPYIIFLEFGSSPQAPAGMMRLTFREMQAADVLTEEMARQFKASIIKVNRKMRKQRTGRLRRVA